MKKTIKKNTMTITQGYVTYKTHDGYEVKRSTGDYDGLGQHTILDAVYNLADNNTIGNQLVEQFGAWLRGEKVSKPLPNLYQL